MQNLIIMRSDNQLCHLVNTDVYIPGSTIPLPGPLIHRHASINQIKTMYRELYKIVPEHRVNDLTLTFNDCLELSDDELDVFLDYSDSEDFTDDEDFDELNELDME